MSHIICPTYVTSSPSIGGIMGGGGGAGVPNLHVEFKK